MFGGTPIRNDATSVILVFDFITNKI
ncbi:unnamed protein product [Acanthoscelides obtectus]|uniref:Uncharacterized protein n=1 Tax=Acanthoscelides obtectus TaxID=200917 RepID=A0A9P0JXV3_ACAOB|nr:unnamed protein product [Acanthoscelides obtectus]CAK1666054.1 hypothetical protein AOBTE_LOCUS25130 [Acanthoscelides obtectus]